MLIKKWIAAIFAPVMMLSFATAEENEVLAFDFNDDHSADGQQDSGTFVPPGEFLSIPPVLLNRRFSFPATGFRPSRSES